MQALFTFLQNKLPYEEVNCTEPLLVYSATTYSDKLWRPNASFLIRARLFRHTRKLRS